MKWFLSLTQHLMDKQTNREIYNMYDCLFLYSSWYGFRELCSIAAMAMAKWGFDKNGNFQLKVAIF